MLGHVSEQFISSLVSSYTALLQCAYGLCNYKRSKSEPAQLSNETHSGSPFVHVHVTVCIFKSSQGIKCSVEIVLSEEEG